MEEHEKWTTRPVSTPDGTEFISECVCGWQSHPQVFADRAEKDLKEHVGAEK